MGEIRTKLVNGRPVRYYEEVTYSASMDDLTEEERKFLFWWIKDNFEPSDKIYTGGTSQQFRYITLWRYDFCVQDTQFMEAMLQCGFPPVDASEYDWRFRVSPKSKAFHNCKHCEGCEHYKAHGDSIGECMVYGDIIDDRRRRGCPIGEQRYKQVVAMLCNTTPERSVNEAEENEETE